MGPKPLWRTLGPSAIVIVCVTFLAFLPSLSAVMTNWDDGLYVIDNPMIKSLSLDSILAMFTSPHYVGNYHPLTLLSLALEYAGFGAEPAIYHFDNVVLHLANSVLVLWLLYLLSNRGPVAFVGALLFAVHPERVESVTWVSARKDVLYAFFFFSALIAYVYYLRVKDRRAAWRIYALSLGLFVLSLLSKGMAVSLSLTLPLIDFLLHRPLTRRIVLDKVPFFTLSVVFGLLVIHAQDLSNSFDARPVAFDRRILDSSFALMLYFKNIMWPTQLSVIYPYPAPALLSWVQVAAIALLAVSVVWSLRVTRVVFFGFAFFLVTIVSVLHVVNVGKAVAADRYTYIPVVGLCFIAGIAFDRLLQWQRRGGFARLRPEHLYSALTAVVVLLCVLTWQRATIWHDSYSLMSDAIEKQPAAADAYINRAVASPKELEAQAIADYRKAISLAPWAGVAYNNLGLLLVGQGKSDEAFAYYNTGIRNDPNNPLLYFNRMIYFNLLQQYAEAYSDMQHVTALGYPMDEAFAKALEQQVTH